MKACAVMKMFDAMIEVVSGGDGASLKKKVLTKLSEDESWSSGSSRSFENIMEETTSQYLEAADRKGKINALSVVANSVPYVTVEKYIPNLSRYMYDKAKRYARRNNLRETSPPKRELQRYSRDAIQFFIDFITSSSVMIGLPYGIKKVKMSDGTKREIPNTIRQQSSTEIYEMYTNLFKNSNQSGQALSRSSVFRILEVCAATDRKATTCVDYFTADGMEAFDELHKTIDIWSEEDLSAQNILKQLKTELFEAAQYLRTDYRLHVKKCSRVPDHCATFALSDPEENSLKSSCSNSSYIHKYDLKCDRCERINATLTQIRELSALFTLNAFENVTTTSSKELYDKRKEEYDFIIRYIEAIIEMKKHYLRAAYTSGEREEIISSLQDDQALITIDFAQKYNPRWHREKQNDYYGKKGISYHISLVTANIGGVYTQHSFVHIYDSEVTQDSKLVVLTLSHVLSELYKVGILQVSIRSDNAGAYHCATTINAMHWLMDTTGVKIASYTFSEAQNGKSSSDRDASRVKRKAENYVAKGGKIRTAAEFFSAMQDGKVLNGMSIHLGSVSVDYAGNSSWSGIARLNHFIIEKDGIRGRRYGGIGEGLFVARDAFAMNGTYSFEEDGFVASGIVTVQSERNLLISGLPTKFWYYTGCRVRSQINSSSSTCIMEDDNTVPEIDDSETHIPLSSTEKLYSCPEVGCSSEFISYWNLEKHMLLGKHKISPEKITLRDMAFRLFTKNIEEVQISRSCPIVADALDELKETTDQTALTTGWALPKKQVRKPFEAHVKQWLVERFNEGLLGKRLDPRTIEKRMTTEKNANGSLKFALHERKDTRQIAGFFSREAQKRRKPVQGRHRRYTSPEIEVDETEEEHEDAGWIRFMKDESFWTEWDELFDAVQDQADFLFDSSSQQSEL